MIRISWFFRTLNFASALSIFLLGSVVLPVQAAESLSLRMAGPDFAPYYFHDAEGKPTGELVRLYAMIVENAGYRWQGSIIPARRVMHGLVKGQYDSSILVKNPLLENSAAMMTSPTHVSEMILNIYFHKDKPAIQGKEQLRGYSVAVMRGYGYGGLKRWLESEYNNLSVYELDSFASVIRLLESRRVDYALLYDVNFAEGVKDLGRSAKDIKSYTLNRVPLYFHLNKDKVPNASQVMEDLMESYRDLMTRGLLAGSESLPEDVIR